MALVVIDRDDDAAFDRWFDVFDRSTKEKLHQRAGWRPSEWRARSNPNDAVIYWLLLADDQDPEPGVVAALEVVAREAMTTTRAEFHVDPRRRRQGLGSVAMAQLEAHARERGFRQLVVFAEEASEEHGAHHDFAAKAGFVVGDVQVRRDLVMPRPPGQLQTLWDQWLIFAADYEIVTFLGQTPANRLDERARLGEQIVADIPHSDLEVDEEHWDAATVRHRESNVVEMGRRLFLSYARHIATDTFVAFSELTVSEEIPDFAYQWDTMVARGHRGHRLGGLMKVANLRALEASGLATRQVSTFNSATNVNMIAVNDALGCVVTERRFLWRKNL